MVSSPLCPFVSSMAGQLMKEDPHIIQGQCQLGSTDYVQHDAVAIGASYPAHNLVGDQDRTF